MLETASRRTRGPSKPPKRRSRAVVVLVSLVLVIMALVVAAGGLYTYFSGASGTQEPVAFTIAPGATGSQVADDLVEQRVVRSAFAFKLVAKVKGIPLEFEAGEYELHTNMKADEVLSVLTAGPPPPEGVDVLFPEGYRLDQDAARAHEALGIDPEAFLDAATSGSFSLPPYLPKKVDSVEGFLFPATYQFEDGVTADQVIQRMVDQFGKVAEDLPWENAAELGVSKFDIVVIASMIEREARFQEDRPKIAAVIYNRLAKGMPLQIDATVQYAKGSWDPVTTADYELDSPYNTYQVDGLPPGPIASPGEASLAAALNPAKANFLYYVVIDAEGHHGFTDSYEEFLQLKDQYQG
jgi:UPF0755 protein